MGHVRSVGDGKFTRLIEKELSEDVLRTWHFNLGSQREFFKTKLV